MKITTTSQTTASPSFATTDLLKLFAGAVASGVVVSLIAAGVAFALASNASATPMTKPAIVSSVAQREAPGSTQSQSPRETDADTIPGSLRIGGGCDSEPIDAIEREWMVSIDGSTAKVRVMQSFVMPEDAGTLAFFDTVLPPDAKLVALNVQGRARAWEGRVMTAESMAKLDRESFQRLDEMGVLLMWLDSRYVTTDQLTNLSPGETVTVEYTYAVSIGEQQGDRVLALKLAPGKTRAADRVAADKPIPVSGTVWVDFVGSLPKRIKNAHRALVVDDSPAGIRGASWYSASLETTETFSIVWELPNVAPDAARVAQR
jgi:hypothetical protein